MAASCVDMSEIWQEKQTREINSREDPDVLQFSSRLVQLLKEHSYVLVRNHGIPVDMVKDASKQMDAFFQLPNNMKTKYACPNGEIYGYVERACSDDKTVLDLCRRYTFFFDQEDIPETHWPEDEVPGIKEMVMGFRSKFCNFMDIIYKCMAIGLGLTDIETFSRHHGLPNSVKAIRFNYIPPIQDCSAEPGVLGLREHKDLFSMTMVFHFDGQYGFQLKTTDGDWVDLQQAGPDTVLLLPGYLMETWTGGLLKAPLHRVVRPCTEEAMKRACQSLVYFSAPKLDHRVQAVTGDMSMDMGVTVREHVIRHIPCMTRTGMWLQNLWLQNNDI